VPYADSTRTVWVRPQQAAAHNGVPSAPIPLLSASGEAPAAGPGPQNCPHAGGVTRLNRVEEAT